MKAKHVFGVFLLFFCCLNFMACEKEDNMIFDFAPIVLRIEIKDAQGNDLLNPETQGNITGRTIRAIYNGKTYVKDEPIEKTKAYYALFEGLQTWKPSNESGEDKYLLTFGEFAGDNTFVNETIIIDYGDGTQDVFAFSSKLTKVSNTNPKIDRKYYRNGEKVDSFFFTVIKEPHVAN